MYYNSRYNESDYNGGIASLGLLGIFIAICFIVMWIGIASNKVTNERVITCTVTSKGIKTDGSESRYLIYTRDDNDEVNVFEITDSVIKGRFDSSDVYGGIEEDKTYEFTVCGERNELFSLYPNIYEYKEVKE